MIVTHATRDDWLRARLTGIGGSDAAAVLGVSSYSSPLKVWADRVSPHAVIEPPPVVGSPLSFGLRLERAIADEICALCEFTIEDVKPRDAFAVSVVFDDVPFMRSTPDFFVRDRHGRRGLLQVKNVDVSHADDWRDGSAPDEYQIQCQHELLTCLSLPDPPEFIALAALIGGNRPVVRVWTLDEAFAAFWIDEATDFWQHVENKTPPKTLAGAGAKRAALALRQLRLDVSIELRGDEWAALAARRLELSRQIAQLKREADEIDARAVLALGDAKRGEVPGVGRVAIYRIEPTAVPQHERSGFSKVQWSKPKKATRRKP